MPDSAIQDHLLPGTPPDVVACYSTLASRAKDTTFGFDEPEVVVLDTETTGLDPASDKLIQISAAVMKGPEVLRTFTTFVNPGRHIPLEIVQLTGITDAMVKDAPVAQQAVSELATFVGVRSMVAHNAPFDRAFLMREARRGAFKGDWLDSLELMRIALPRMRDHKLENLSRAFGVHSSTHRADDDVAALCSLWRVALVALTDFPPGFVRWLAELRPQTSWPLRQTIAQVASSLPDAGFSLRTQRLNRVASVMPREKDDALKCSGDYPTERAVAAAFREDDVVGQMYPGFEPREEQVQMALEITRAFQTDTSRAIEAGTGVGKSIAYLLPEALTAKALNITVGVATKTNALMDQLVYHELPALAAALPDGLEYVALKGYDHYPCLRKLAAFANLDGPENEEAARGELMMIAVVYAYLMQTMWGDFDAINLYWRGLPRDRITASPSDCMHHRCPFFSCGCLIHGLRARAKTADIVVTNHALLFRDVMAEGGILPPIRHWVIDEAHAAESEARRQLSPQLRETDLMATLDSLCGPHQALLVNVRRKARALDGGDLIVALASKAEQQALTVQTLAISFFSFVKDLGALADAGSYDTVDLWINAEVREGGPWGVVAGTGRSLGTRLQELIASCHSMDALFEESPAEAVELRSELNGLTCALQEMYDALVVFIGGESDEYAYSATINRNPDLPREVLSSSLMDVGQSLVDSFYPETLSVIYTSATMATGTSFAHFERAVGLDRLDKAAYSTLQLSSSYDYDENMRVLVPTDLPEPGTRGHLDALEGFLFDLHVAMGGSTLTLFTNRREMEQLFEKLQPRLDRQGIHLVCQLKGTSMKRVRDEFLSDENTCLFALRSFWEGFDAPGDTLRCVIIPRLPFSRPNDPLSLERGLHDERAWAHYSLPEAVISLKQAAGRLVRSSTDSGYLVLADSRLVSRRYGAAFLKALPSANQCLTTTAEVCRLIGEDPLRRH